MMRWQKKYKDLPTTMNTINPLLTDAIGGQCSMISLTQQISTTKHTVCSYNGTNDTNLFRNARATQIEQKTKIESG